MGVDFFISLLVLVLVGGLIVYLFFMLIDYLPLPAPFNMVAKALVILIAIVILLQRSGVLHGF